MPLPRREISNHAIGNKNIRFEDAGVVASGTFSLHGVCRSDITSECRDRRLKDRRAHLQVHLRAVSGAWRRHRQHRCLGRAAGRPQVLLSGLGNRAPAAAADGQCGGQSPVPASDRALVGSNRRRWSRHHGYESPLHRRPDAAGEAQCEDAARHCGVGHCCAQG